MKGNKCSSCCKFLSNSNI